MVDFVVPEIARVGVQLVLHRTVAAERHPIVGAVIGDQRRVKGRKPVILGTAVTDGRERIGNPNLVFEIPEIVILGVEGGAQIRGAGGGLIVHFQPRVQRQLVFDLEGENGGARVRAGTDDGVNLAVAAGIGRIELTLKDVGVQEDVGMQAGQRRHHVIAGEIAVSGHIDGGQAAFGDLDFYGAVGELLLGQADGDGDQAALPVGHLEVGQSGAQAIQRDVGAKSLGGIGQGAGDGFRRQNGVAGNHIFFDREGAGLADLVGLGAGGPGDQRGAQGKQEAGHHGQASAGDGTVGGFFFRRGSLVVLMTPFAGRHAEALFKHGVEQSQMAVAAFEGDVNDFILGIHQQPVGALEA